MRRRDDLEEPTVGQLGANRLAILAEALARWGIVDICLVEADLTINKPRQSCYSTIIPTYNSRPLPKFFRR